VRERGASVAGYKLHLNRMRRNARHSQFKRRGVGGGQRGWTESRHKRELNARGLRPTGEAPPRYRKPWARTKERALLSGRWRVGGGWGPEQRCCRRVQTTWRDGSAAAFFPYFCWWSPFYLCSRASFKGSRRPSFIMSVH
jgi:hypothetical protein